MYLINFIFCADATYCGYVEMQHKSEVFRRVSLVNVTKSLIENFIFGQS